MIRVVLYISLILGSWQSANSAAPLTPEQNQKLDQALSTIQGLPRTNPFQNKKDTTTGSSAQTDQISQLQSKAREAYSNRTPPAGSQNMTTYQTNLQTVQQIEQTLLPYALYDSKMGTSSPNGGNDFAFWVLLNSMHTAVLAMHNAGKSLSPNQIGLYYQLLQGLRYATDGWETFRTLRKMVKILQQQS